MVVAAPDAGERGRVLGRDGLLDPARRVRLERGRHLRGGVGREAAVHLDHQVDVRPDRLAHGGDDGQRPAPVAAAMRRTLAAPNGSSFIAR